MRVRRLGLCIAATACMAVISGRFVSAFEPASNGEYIPQTLRETTSAESYKNDSPVPITRKIGIRRIGLFTRSQMQSRNCGQNQPECVAPPAQCGVTEYQCQSPAQCAAPPQSPPSCDRHTPRESSPLETPREIEESLEEEIVPEPEPVFIAPPTSGEVTGESRSLEMPSIAITLPEVKLSLPRLTLLGARRGLRSPEMNVDGGRAPMARGEPNLYGQLVTNPETPRATQRVVRNNEEEEPSAPRNTTPRNIPRELPPCGPRRDACGPQPMAEAPQPEDLSSEYPVPAPPAEEMPETEAEDFQRSRQEVLEQLRQAQRKMESYRRELQRLQEELNGDLSLNDELPEEESNVQLAIDEIPTGRRNSSPSTSGNSNRGVQRTSRHILIDSDSKEEEHHRVRRPRSSK